jgi:hypothetical protein
MNNTNSANAIQVLNDVIAVNLDFSIWSGRKILEENDLSLQGKTPPKEIINLGSKHTTNPEALKPFNKLKRRAERSCLRYGIPFLGGYAVPHNRAKELAKELSEIIQEFDVERLDYLANHEATQEEWIEKYPDYTEILKKASTTVEYVAKRISASFSMFQIKSAENALGFDAGLSNQLESLGMTLDDEILKTSGKLLENLSSAIAPNRTNVNSLISLCEKVEGLAFLDSRFESLVQEIKKVEATMPISGKLNANEVNTLSGLLYRMSDPVKLDILMNNINSSNKNDDPVNAEPIATSNTNDIEDMLTGSFDIGFDSDINDDISDDINYDISDDIYEDDFSFDVDFDFQDDSTITVEDSKEKTMFF